jgi:hypothetical protein
MSDAKTCPKNPAVEFLKDHPRMMGVLFTVCLFLSQAGSVAAANGGAIR